MELILERKTLLRNQLAGLSNLMNIELLNWFKTKKIWFHLTLWSTLLFGLVVLAGIKQYTENLSIGMYLNFYGVFGAIGVILSVQGVLIGERRSGITSWLLSKPISRTSYIVSKFLGNLSGFFVSMGLFPLILNIAYVSVRSEYILPVSRFLVFISCIIIYLSFYLSLTIMLGTIFLNRGLVAGIPLGVFFAQSLLSGVLPKQALYFPNTMLSGDEDGVSLLGDYFFNGTISSF